MERVQIRGEYVVTEIKDEVVKGGGRNTRFFHRVCKDRVVRRSLVNLRVNNEICEDPDQNKCSIFNHLKKN